MYLLASTGTVIRCSARQVFDCVSDLTRFPQWFPGAIEVRALDALEPATVGKRYHETVALPLRGRQPVLIRVVQAEPPRRFVTEGSLPLLMPRMEIDLEDAGAQGCRVRWRMLSRNTALLPRWTALPLARRATQQRADAAMGRLKALLEPQDARAGQAFP